MKGRDEVTVGVFIFLVIAIGIVGTLYLARRGVGGTYELYTRFSWGVGLKQGQPVRLAGVQIGAVDKVILRQDGLLDVALKVDKSYKVPLGSTATIKPEGVFGDQSVALTPCQTIPSIVPGGDSAAPNRVTAGADSARRRTSSHDSPAPDRRCPSFFSYYSPGDTIPAGRASLTVDELLVRMDTLSRTVNEIAVAVRMQLVQGGSLAELHKTIASTNALVLRLNSVAAEQSKGLTATLASIRRTTTAIDSQQVDSAVRNFQATTRNLVAMSAELQKTSERLDSVMAKLQAKEGTAGKLLNGPALYDDPRDLVTRLDSVTADFKRNPKKYVNLKVF